MTEYVTIWVDDLPDLKRGEEIVWCRDCDFSPDGGKSCYQWLTQDCFENTVPERVEPDGFCFRGKRKVGA